METDDFEDFEPVPHPRVKPAAVYMIQRLDRRRFKLGVSIDPLMRAAQLPEFHHRALDLSNSLALWLPSTVRANQVERGMHKCLAPYKADPGHRESGFTEWFSPAAFPTAVRMLQEMPKNGAGKGTLGLRAFLPNVIHVQREEYQSAQDVWWMLEDLLLRLADALSVEAHMAGNNCRFTVQGFRDARRGVMNELRWRILDTDSLEWRTPSAHGNFVSLIDYEGNDLVVVLVNLKRIQRWPEGVAILWQIRALVSRLSRDTTPPAGANHAH